MNNQQKKVAYIIWWIVGIFFVVVGLGTLSLFILSSILLVAAGLFVIPPGQEIIEKKLNFRTETWMKIAILVVVFGIVVIITPIQVEDNNLTDDMSSNDSTTENPANESGNIQQQLVRVIRDSDGQLIHHILYNSFNTTISK